jgi:predicted AlkP superfamily phosphohydrolase/phosphomutase
LKLASALPLNETGLTRRSYLMSSASGINVLAIGIDAAEATFVRQLIEQGDMPALRGLLEEGQWLRVESPAPIGSGAVWPTFMTGVDPLIHGIYSEWSWIPEAMGVTRYHGRNLTPFWKSLAQQNISLGVFDVPFALPVGVSRGFEVCDWWAHDATGAGLQAGPNGILSLVNHAPSHPLSANRFVDTTPDNLSNLKELTTACIAGVKLRGMLAQRLICETRPQLSLLVFPEIHHAGHQMWHTVEPDHQFYAGRKINDENALEPLLKKVYRAVDEQIAGLIKLAGSDAAVMVFALHGMRPALGFPAFLGPLLCERGFSGLESWTSQTWSRRAISLLATTKRNTPDGLKKVYYKLAPTAATHKLARPTMLPAYNWKTTRAFSLPTDQYGWIRVNLSGREAQGIVSPDQYDETCEQLEAMLLGLTTESGASLVRDIVRTAASAKCALGNPLPDLVVHWEDAAFASPLRIKDSKVRAEPVGKKSTGQHASEGFCIYRGADGQYPGGVVAAKDIGRLITAGIV